MILNLISLEAYYRVRNPKKKVVLITIFVIIFILSIKSFYINLTSSFIRRITAISFLYAGVLSFNTLFIQAIGSGIGMYSGLFEVSILSSAISIFILIISSIILFIWPNLGPLFGELKIELEKIKENYNFISNHNKSNQYCLIVLFNILGALFLISSSDLISMYLSIELQSFGLYILATLYKEKLSSTSAGLKYFLLGGLSSCIILLGSGLVYTYTGLTNLELIYTLISIYYKNNFIDMNGISIGIFLIFSGFLFKIAASPFHNWSIDVYDDSPTLVTIWLTILPKISILIFLLQLLIGINVYLNFCLNLNFIENLPSINILSNILLLSSLLSLIIGAIVGLNQIKIKRLLAYSTINHIGFLLLSLSVFISSSASFIPSVESFIFYIIQYTITNLNIFLIILALSYIINKKINITYEIQARTRENANNLIKKSSEKTKIIHRTGTINISDIEYINSFKGIFYNNPVLALSLSICLFSFAGVPPLIGFFAKQQVLYSSNAAGYFFLSIVAILVSVISAFYYLKIIKIVFSMPKSESLNYNMDEYKLNFHEPKKIININENNAKKNSPQNLINTPLIIETEHFNNYNDNIKNTFGVFNNTQLTPKINTNKINIQILSNIHSLLIGILTIFIIIFILNPELLLNSIAIITSLIFI